MYGAMRIVVSESALSHHRAAFLPDCICAIRLVVSESLPDGQTPIQSFRCTCAIRFMVSESLCRKVADELRPVALRYKNLVSERVQFRRSIQTKESCTCAIRLMVSESPIRVGGRQ